MLIKPIEAKALDFSWQKFLFNLELELNGQANSADAVPPVWIPAGLDFLDFQEIGYQKW